MRKYEAMIIFYPNEEEKKDQVLERFQNIITEGKGAVTSVDEWGNRKLAYLIDDLSEGYYVLLNYEGTPEITKELDRVAGITDSVMRIMITRENE